MIFVKIAESKEAQHRFAGATIVITRPVGGGATLARCGAAGGGRPLLLPGLALRALATGHGACRARFAQSKATSRFSPARLRCDSRLLCARRCASRANPHSRSAPAPRARSRGTASTRSIPTDRSDSEGLLALRGLSHVRGRRIALIGAPGGRDLIAPTLRRRGATVEAIHVYRRAAPRLTRRHFDALDAAPDPLITLVSSGEALTNLVSLVARAADRAHARADHRGQQRPARRRRARARVRRNRACAFGGAARSPRRRGERARSPSPLS